jgi:hypothetical protein
MFHVVGLDKEICLPIAEVLGLDWVKTSSC